MDRITGYGVEAVMNDYLLTPQTENGRWLECNGVRREDAGLKEDVLLATPALFNAFTNCVRTWDLKIENLHVVWEPMAGSGVIRAVNVELGSKGFSVYRISSSPSMAVTQLEMLIAMGPHRLLFLGDAQPISPGLEKGAVLAPSFAVRDDGISGHYLPEDSPAIPDEILHSEILQAADDLGIAVSTAGVWSNGAIFRRSRSRSEELVREGVIAVETEVAALFAVAAERKVSLAALLVIGGEEASGESDAGSEDGCRIVMKVLSSRK